MSRILDSVMRSLFGKEIPYEADYIEVRNNPPVGARPPKSRQLTPWSDSARTAEAYHAQVYSKLALVFRCIQTISQSFATAPLRVYEGPWDRLIPDEEHKVRQLIQVPNTESTEFRFMQQVIATTLIAGFCPIEIQRIRGQAVGLWPVNPMFAKPKKRGIGPPDWCIKVPGYPEVVVDADDMIVLTYSDRFDGRATGMGPLEVIFEDSLLLRMQNDFLTSFFSGGAMPVYALIPADDARPVSQAQADVIRESWKQRYGGLGAGSEPAVLTGIKDVKRLSFDFDELALNDIRDLSDISICQAFGVPPSIVGTRIGLQSNTFTNYGEGRKSFYEDTVTPLWERAEDAFTRGLAYELEPSILKYDRSAVPALREDTLPRRQWALEAAKGGFISSHAFARECGIEAQGADVFLRNIGIVEVPVELTEARPVIIPGGIGDDAGGPTESRGADPSPDDVEAIIARATGAYLERSSRGYASDSGEHYSGAEELLRWPAGTHSNGTGKH